MGNLHISLIIIHTFNFTFSKYRDLLPPGILFYICGKIITDIINNKYDFCDKKEEVWGFKEKVFYFREKITQQYLKKSE